MGINRKEARSTGARDYANWLVDYYGGVIKETLQGRGNLSRDDLEYLVLKTDTMKDERLKTCIATLVGWGDEDRAELETFFAIALEVIRETPPSRIHSAARKVEIRGLMKDL